MNTPFVLNATDRHFADFIAREAGSASPWLWHAVSLASNAVAGGNICLNLGDIAGAEIEVDGELYPVPSLEELRGHLSQTSVVGSPGEFRPLVLDEDGRLYLYRYWKYERDLVRVIREKSACLEDGVDEPLLAAGVGRLFPASPGEVDWQKLTALAAVRKRFSVISGGPGTGKTSTVVKILALLLEQAAGKKVRIALAAPTGKAAARLKDSIRGMKEKLDTSAEIRALIPEEVSTIHRLLGVRAGSFRFRHSEDNPLPFDVVIIDEASMVALPLMAKLATALKPDARFILLGDRDQLASVEAGAALGDICGGGRREPFSEAFSAFAERVAGEVLPPYEPGSCLTDSLVVLKKNYRFGSESGIGASARAVNAGEGRSALSLLREGRDDVRWQAVPAPERLKKSLTEQVITGYRGYLCASTAEEALRRFDSFRILCALRQGPYGVTGMNDLVEEILSEKGLIQKGSRWYSGRPIMITVNDYNLKLFNGDIGIVLPDQEGEGALRVFFPSPDGGVRKVSPVRLPAHDTVFAMTVHKSQGSEFDKVLMVLPAHETEALTRELIYTGITRAKSSVEIWGDEEVFLGAVSRKVDRKSGLRDALWTVAEGAEIVS
ncbi:exodeoxyribonuclease V subunit alpha [Geomonas sp. RF6]|uniref:exodeoxyribonuclease V subunit alpha n=1 Tax=Geomonas sp. RF6 TaxID=2897342 RepID=UPI001E2CC125|nr:exodeoxyribonuclease V subunit alpha [Geomonas sp. RF6]UFS70143.1 exodeoxyribonuclease V subunit alpha [Geomonas sp. RF6]